MDAFRLLSKSTSLRGKPKTGTVSAAPSASSAGKQQQIPSQGKAADPRIFGRGEKLADCDNKRKLDEHLETAKDEDEDELGELDFFRKPLARNFKRARTASDINIGDDTSKVQGSNTEEDLNIKHLDKDECRRILKAHKIKAAQLWSPSFETEDASKAKKRRKKQKDNKGEDMLRKQKKRKQPELALQPLTRFSSLQPRLAVHRRICENLASQGYETPTEVQMGGLPILLDNEGPVVDLLSVAPTGSGKTLAFLIPTLNAVKRDKLREDATQRKREVRAVILAPTKELASQIVNEGRKLAKSTGIQVTLLKKGARVGEQLHQAGGSEESDEGGSNAEEEEEEDKSEDEADANQDDHARLRPEMIVKSDIIVSTPLNMVHALGTSVDTTGRLPSASLLVLDEADVLLDPLFRQQTLQIWKALTNPGLRVSLWSATMGASIEDLAASYVAERWASLSEEEQRQYPRAAIVRLVIGLKDSAVPSIHHRLVYAATEQGKLMGLRQILRGDPTAISSGQNASGTAAPKLQPPFLVFTQTIARAIALHSELLYDIPAEAGGSSRIAVLHSDLTDRARDIVMTRFRKGEIWTLITTDLLSRGVDFRGVNGVVNYDFPNSAAAYIHRVGRTGRAGREGGVAVTLYAKEDIPFVKNVANVIAASERLKNTDKVAGEGTPQWLLSMLPKVSKRDKQRLKRGGVESRRTGKEDATTRISTKSGYERKTENRRKGAVTSSKGRLRSRIPPATAAVPAGDSDGSFGGFD